jgi:hypothetical protein
VVDEAFGPGRDDPVIAADVQKYVSVVRPNPVMVGIAFPGTLILDRRGRVTSRFFEEFYRERNTVSSILLRLGHGGTPVTATEISTTHLQVRTYPSDAVIAPGSRFSLALNVVPRPRMHVYAPGAQDYRVIALTVAPQPFVRLLPIRYPDSEIYFFKPLNERVPVYQKPFTLLQDVVLESTPQAQAAWRGKESLTLTGSLDYQACDDRICFDPVSIPLSWTLTLRSHIAEPPPR